MRGVCEAKEVLAVYVVGYAGVGGGEERGEKGEEGVVELYEAWVARDEIYQGPSG